MSKQSTTLDIPVKMISQPILTLKQSISRANKYTGVVLTLICYIATFAFDHICTYVSFVIKIICAPVISSIVVFSRMNVRNLLKSPKLFQNSANVSPIFNIGNYLKTYFSRIERQYLAFICLIKTMHCVLLYVLNYDFWRYVSIAEILSTSQLGPAIQSIINIKMACYLSMINPLIQQDVPILSFGISRYHPNCRYLLQISDETVCRFNLFSF